MIFCYTVILIRCLFPLQVKTNGPKHTCSSVNQCGDTMASSNWVAERVVEFLKEDSTMGPTELQGKLKNKYALEVPYSKVFRGKKKALEMIFGKWMTIMTCCPHIELSYSNQLQEALLS